MLESQRIQQFKDGDLLLMKLAADICLEELEKAVIHREKMRRRLYWAIISK